MSRTPQAAVECADVEPRVTTTTSGATAGDIMTAPVITVTPKRADYRQQRDRHL
jgi:hypothetical protein